MKHLVAAAVAVVLLAGCAQKSDPNADAAAEAAKLRSELPTTTTAVSTSPPTAPPMPAALTKNPIFRVGKLASADCSQAEFETISLATVRSYYTRYVACLNKAWAPAIRKAGFTFKPPKLVVVLGQSPSSPCDVDDGADYYCGDTIYMDATGAIAGYPEDPDRTMAWMALEIGHEYGHHVQALSGMLRALQAREDSLNGVDAHLEDSRRLELQASCFSGVYIGADRPDFGVSPEWLNAWSLMIRDVEDPKHDHGNGENHGYWTTSGFDSADPGACNTYTVASSLVG